MSGTALAQGTHDRRTPRWSSSIWELSTLTRTVSNCCHSNLAPSLSKVSVENYAIKFATLPYLSTLYWWSSSASAKLTKSSSTSPSSYEYPWVEKSVPPIGTRHMLYSIPSSAKYDRKSFSWSCSSKESMLIPVASVKAPPQPKIVWNFCSELIRIWLSAAFDCSNCPVDCSNLEPALLEV
jgi:hypothetical protein